MQPLSEAAFARRLRALSAQERLRFLARLWEARGHTTRVDDDRLIARREMAAGDRDVTSQAETPVQELTIVVTGPIGYGSVDAAADVVVTTRETALVRRVTTNVGAELVSPADLLERLLYGIDRETAKAITSEYLGGSLMQTQTPTEDSERSVSRRVGAVVIGVVVIAVIIGAAWPVLPMTDGVNSQDRVSSSESATTPAAETGDQLPDGLSGGEVTNPQAATAAHNAIVEGRARELRFEYATAGNGTRLGGITEYSATVQYVNDSRYAFDVTRVNEGEVPVHREQFVVDGVALEQEQRGNETEYTRRENQSIGVWNGFQQSRIRLYTAALSVNQMSVREVSSGREGEPMLRLDLRGTPSTSFLRSERIEAVAFVTREGRLTRLQVKYTSEATGEPVRVVFGVRLLEDSTVAQPEWYGTALNQTT